MRVSFKALVKPVPKGRPRFACMGKHVRTYTPTTTAEFEQKIRIAARSSINPMPKFDGPLSVSIVFGMPVPKSWPRKAREDALRGVLMPKARPDIDNLEKAVLDALNGLLWVDDAQVVRKIGEKRYVEEPFVEVSVEEIYANTDS